MKAAADAAPEGPASTVQAYRCTFGIYNQTTPWSDVRALPWPDLAALLTTHEIGPKDGSCVVPAVFRGTRRHKNDAQRIEVVLLDSDTGATLDEITAALTGHGWAAAVSSTHSHLTTRTAVRRSGWDKFLATGVDPEHAAAAFLEEVRGYRLDITTARLAEETPEQVVLEHPPCPKFRIALPLLRPWAAEAYETQTEANAAWKERIEALAAALHLAHDQACTDTSRLFYLPRRPADGPAPETAILDGVPCDIFALPGRAQDESAGRPRGRRSTRQKGPQARRQAHASDAPSFLSYIDPDTGEVLNLRAWAKRHAGRFEIAAALRARSPHVFHAKSVQDGKHHLRCCNEDAHTQAGTDLATFVVNASESLNRGFVHHCRHAHCEGEDRLLFLHRMLERRWLIPADLIDPLFLAAPQPDDLLDADELTEHAVALRFTHRYADKLRYCHTRGAWYVWSGTHWAMNETRLAFTWARHLVASLNRDASIKVKAVSGKAAFAAAVERYAQADEAHAVTNDVWDPDPFLLCTPGGVVDLRTGHLRPATPADHVSRITAVAPDANAHCPRWRQFLVEVTGNDPALIRFLQQWFGYSLTGDTREEALLFVHGKGGNGKGKLLNAVQGILGTYCRTAAMDTFTASQGGDRHPTDLAMLAGARMVCASETEEGKAWAEVRIKQMTGNDMVPARFMRQDFFEYRPQFKLTIIGNHKPTLKNVDDAARRRFNIVPFDFTPKPKDTQLEAKLRAEWPGILRWLIEGCLDWQRNGLVRPPVVLQATDEYFAQQDYFGRWLAEGCILDGSLATKPVTLLQSFQQWCQANGETLTDNSKLRGMIERTPGLRYVTNKGVQLVRGIGLRPADPPRWGGGVEGGGG